MTEPRFTLELHEAGNPVWRKVRDHLEKRLAMLRRQNDGRMDEYDTAHLRGRIAELKILIDLGKEPPPPM